MVAIEGEMEGVWSKKVYGNNRKCTVWTVVGVMFVPTATFASAVLGPCYGCRPCNKHSRSKSVPQVQFLHSLFAVSISLDKLHEHKFRAVG